MSQCSLILKTKWYCASGKGLEFLMSFWSEVESWVCEWALFWSFWGSHCSIIKMPGTEFCTVNKNFYCSKTLLVCQYYKTCHFSHFRQDFLLFSRDFSMWLIDCEEFEIISAFENLPKNHLIRRENWNSLEQFTWVVFLTFLGAKIHTFYPMFLKDYSAKI